MSQNRNTDSTIASNARKRYAAKRRTSAMLSVSFFLQDIATPFEIIVTADTTRSCLYNLNSNENAMRREIPENFQIYFTD